jgi:hypothetical protein
MSEMRAPTTQAECDRHNAKRDRAYAKAKALRADERAKCEAMKAAKIAVYEEPVYKEEKRIAYFALHRAWLDACKAANAAESRAEAIPYATLDIFDEFGSRF